MAANSMGVEPLVGTTTFDFDNPILRETGLGAIWLDDPVDGEAREDGPVMLMVDLPPDVPGPAHWHDCDSVTVMIEGSMKIGKSWVKPGMVRVQEKGRAYGPTLTGPDGYRALLIFTERSKVPDEFVNDEIRESWKEGTEKIRAWLTRKAPYPENLLELVQPHQDQKAVASSPVNG